MSVEKDLAVLSERVAGIERARDLQAGEYSRRLDELNHAHAMATQDKLKFVTGDVFYAKLDNIAERMAALELWRSKVLGIYLGIASLAGLAGALITGLLLKILQ